MNKKLRILFMGSPEFAAHNLKQLSGDGFLIVGVVTGPDRKKGRGQQLAEPAVKTVAKALNIPVYQPENLKEDSFFREMKSLEPDLGVVVAFRMLPEKIWTLPKLGTINLHASLLPDYRGAAPINHVIMNGEEKTGVTTFFLKHEIDTGDVILQKEIPIGQKMNAGDLHQILMEEGSIMLSETVRLIEEGNYKIKSQSELTGFSKVQHQAPKIFKNDCRINWNDSAQKVYNFIRGLSPQPGAWTTLVTKDGQEYIFKIYSAEISEIKSSANENRISVSGEQGLLIACADFCIKPNLVQLEGKQKMSCKEFLKGFSFDSVRIK